MTGQVCSLAMHPDSESGNFQKRVDKVVGLDTKSRGLYHLDVLAADRLLAQRSKQGTSGFFPSGGKIKDAHSPRHIKSRQTLPERQTLQV